MKNKNLQQTQLNSTFYNELQYIYARSYWMKISFPLKLGQNQRVTFSKEPCRNQNIVHSNPSSQDPLSQQCSTAVMPKSSHLLETRGTSFETHKPPPAKDISEFHMKSCKRKVAAQILNITRKQNIEDQSGSRQQIYTNWQKWEASFINAKGRNNITFCAH